MSSEIKSVEFTEIESEDSTSSIFNGLPIELLKDVTVKLSAYIGDAEISIAKLSELSKGELIKISADADATVDIVLNGNSIARGRLVIVDGCFGVQLTEAPKL